MSALARLLRSSRLALGLCLALAAHAMAGTVLPAWGAANPVFLILVALFMLNVAFCTVHRLRAARRAGGRLEARAGLDALLHLSLVLIFAGGALKAALASVGTQYLFLGETVTSVSTGPPGNTAPLGFGLLLKERVEEYFPIALQVGIRDPRPGGGRSIVLVREGRGARVPGTEARLEVGTCDLDARWVGLRSVAGGRVTEHRLDLAPGGTSSFRLGDLTLELLAWRRDLRAVRGRIALLDGGREVAEEWLAVNSRISHRGTSVFLTAWGKDEYGNPYLGVQASRDPGAPVFWAGATLLAVSAPIFILARRRRRDVGPRLQ